MIIGPRKDSRIAPFEPSTHSTKIPFVIDLSATTDSQDMTSPFTETGSGDAHDVSKTVNRNIPMRFIENPHHF
jgi:hypothetical protein